MRYKNSLKVFHVHFYKNNKNKKNIKRPPNKPCTVTNPKYIFILSNHSDSIYEIFSFRSFLKHLLPQIFIYTYYIHLYNIQKTSPHIHNFIIIFPNLLFCGNIDPIIIHASVLSRIIRTKI